VVVGDWGCCLRNFCSICACSKSFKKSLTKPLWSVILSDADSANLALVEVLKYAIIVFGSLPVLMLYPFIQKYFVKGVMIGSLKG
jgi:ABC-type glycerol-3-phosphate transport system permease component